MAQCLTWQVINRQQTSECLDAVDLEALRVILKNIDEEKDGELLHPRERTTAQVNVLLDLYGHLVLFAKAAHFSPFKASTVFGIVHEVHETSVAGRLSRVSSYDLLRELVVRHSVHRPPYSTMIFNVRDVQDIDTYMMSTYYRHYKMYVYCFVPREVATLRTMMLNDIAEAPPVQLPPLSAAIREDAWREKMQEKARAVEEAEMEEQAPASDIVSDAQRRAATLDNPEFKAGIREQLETIRNAVSKKSTDRLDLIEEKLTLIESKVSELQVGGNRSRQGSKGSARKK
ncbi:Flagellar C1a complex subunit C1a-32 [Novymonas esmeraldas]|uniref:Flagellar C1a complex subunit C1a-32 n=1 Tax=Novymonas esmeraldas TaxID=1808958 RepID=A0AAW0F698_9TRYP